MDLMSKIYEILKQFQLYFFGGDTFDLKSIYSLVARRIDIQLAAGAYYDVEEAHTFLRVEAGNNVNVNIDGLKPDLYYPAGTGYQQPNNRIVRRCRITNADAAPQTITIYYGTGDFLDTRVTLSGAISITNSKASPLYVEGNASSFQASSGTVGTGAAGLISSATCIRFIVQNTGTTNLYVGDSGLNATLNGIKLLPEASLEVENAGGLDYRIISDAAGGAYKFMRWFK